MPDGGGGSLETLLDPAESNHWDTGPVERTPKPANSMSVVDLQERLGRKGLRR